MKKPIKFDFHYFDNPNGMGYQGYEKRKYGNDVTEIWEEVTNFCISKNINSVIDLGCAKGFLIESLISNNINALGYDISEYAISFTKNLPCYQYDISNGLNIQADVICALGVLIYIEYERLDFVINSIFNSSKQFFLFSAHYKENKQIIPDSLRKVTESRMWWKNKITSLGFKFIRTTDFFDVYSKF